MFLRVRFSEGVKEGICPIPLPVEACEDDTDDECTLDSDCFGEMKCCSDSCQKLCVQPPQSKSTILTCLFGSKGSQVAQPTGDYPGSVA